MPHWQKVLGDLKDASSLRRIAAAHGGRSIGRGRLEFDRGWQARWIRAGCGGAADPSGAGGRRDDTSSASAPRSRRSKMQHVSW